MVTDKMPYPGLTKTLKYLKIQAIESIPFAAEKCPMFTNPRDLFYWLKTWLRYENDPEKTELLQTMQTMWDNGGRGDCDCFVITTIACLYVMGFPSTDVILVGRKPSNAVHIYTQVIYKGEPYILDLTNSLYDYERSYPYKQVLPCNINL